MYLREGAGCYTFSFGSIFGSIFAPLLGLCLYSSIKYTIKYKQLELPMLNLKYFRYLPVFSAILKCQSGRSLITRDERTVVFQPMAVRLDRKFDKVN